MASFRELATVSIGENKNLVISETSEKQISIAQQLVFTNTNGASMNMFVKNAIILDNPEAIDKIINTLQKAKENL